MKQWNKFNYKAYWSLFWMIFYIIFKENKQANIIAELKQSFIENYGIFYFKLTVKEK